MNDSVPIGRSQPGPPLRGPHTGFRRVLVWISAIALLFVALLSAGRGQAQSVTKEQQIQAAFLINFTKYVSFPKGRFEKNNSPIVFSVVGDKTVEAVVEKMLPKRTIKGRPLRLAPPPDKDTPLTAHVVLLLGQSDGILDSAKKSGTLTVVESARFWKKGGIIHLRKKGGKIRFAINMKQAKEQKLAISSQLQKLAVELIK